MSDKGTCVAEMACLLQTMFGPVSIGSRLTIVPDKYSGELIDMRGKV